MATRSQTFDVWLTRGDTVYRAVPYSVVTGWAEQGRLGPDDKIRPASTTDTPWQRVADNPQIGDYLYRRPTIEADTAQPTDAAEQLHAVELDVPIRKHADDEDDDVDMIPLIDISLVLLIFFMMTTAVAALSPVDVPEMKNAAELSTDAEALTVHIDKRSNGEVVFALRVGDKPPLVEDNNLRTIDDVMKRLDAKLGGLQRAPEVRIACHKELERGWVRDVARELEKRKAKEQIGGYAAEVNERK